MYIYVGLLFCKRAIVFFVFLFIKVYRINKQNKLMLKEKLRNLKNNILKFKYLLEIITTSILYF